MKRFALEKKPADTYTFSVMMVVIASLIAITNLFNRPVGDLFVSVYIEQQLINQYSLEDDQNLTFLQADYPILLGDIVLAIEDQRMRIIQETSPLNVCSQQGWVGSPGLPIICAPNFFMAVIETPRESV
jgi:hypothetical protein